MKRSIVVSVVVVAAALTLSAKKTGDPLRNWPSWRGPTYNGVAAHGNPPTEWSETRNVRWKIELPGPGHSTPIVWGKRIYVLSAVETPSSPSPAQRFVVSAHDRKNGKTVWKTTVREEAPHEAGHTTASQASASPVTDGEHLYAFFGSRGLYALDMKGNVQWEKDLGDMQTRNAFGEGASPVLHGDTLVVNWDHEGDSFIVALDKRTGEERWRRPRDERTSWSTPLVIEDEGRARVVVSATNRVRAYDLKTGAEVWECAGLGVNCTPTPVADDELVFVMSGYREAAGMAIRYGGAEGDLTGGDAVAWRIDRGLSYVPSPLLYDGKLYFLERFKGVLSCYDLKSGEALYTEQRLEGLGNIYASPVAADGRIYVLDRDGNAIVFKHGDGFEVLARNKLDDAFDASPVIVGEAIYLRGHRYLYALAGE